MDLTKQPHEIELEARQKAAETTLLNLGYEYHGGMLWKPPLGDTEKTSQLLDTIDELRLEVNKLSESLSIERNAIGSYVDVMRVWMESCKALAEELIRLEYCPRGMRSCFEKNGRSVLCLSCICQAANDMVNSKRIQEPIQVPKIPCCTSVENDKAERLGRMRLRQRLVTNKAWKAVIDILSRDTTSDVGFHTSYIHEEVNKLLPNPITRRNLSTQLSIMKTTGLITSVFRGYFRLFKPEGE